MLRIILFLVVIALGAAGAAWLAEQPGNVVLSWSGWRAEMTLAVFVLVLIASLAAIAVGWAVVTGILRAPGRLRRKRRERRQARGRQAITQGLLAVGYGDNAKARSHAKVARRAAPQDPLALLLQAQSAQLDGDREGARRAFLAMSNRADTKSLGLRGLYVEAQRADDPYAALTIAEEALRISPGSPWASEAVLGFRCARGDWNGALDILDSNLGSGLLDKKQYRRQRGVLLTARAIELEETDRNLSRDSALEAVKLAPTLVPAAVLASKYLAEVHQVRRALKILETAWLANPHPDLAEAYAQVKPGDNARARLIRVEVLAAKTPGHLESGLAVARAAIDAGEFVKARGALAPFIEAPTQRVAMLMAEIEHGERADSGRSRAWTQRALRALPDPVWTADGYVSDYWRPVSPITGQLDAFQWQIPFSALPSNKAVLLETDASDDPLLAAPSEALPPDDPKPASELLQAPPPPAPDVAPAAPAAAHPENAVQKPEESPPAPAGDTVIPLPAAPLSQRRQQRATSAPVIPIVRAPDDPGIEEEPSTNDEFAERNVPPESNWRGQRPRRDS